MFSVKIGKLLEMTDAEKTDYQEFADRLRAKGIEDVHTLAVIGAEAQPLKIAKALSGSNERVLFVDGDFTQSVFLGRYKLGRKLKGWTDICQTQSDLSDLICVTSDPDIDLMFTGDTKTAWSNIVRDDLKKGLDALKDRYAWIVVSSDEEGRAAQSADAAVVAMKQSEYSDYNARSRVERLDREGGPCGRCDFV
ncbi:MAG: hypothetical protein LKE69_04925 [Lachnospiraceae bacterium]|jgi:predicted nuclease of predicted toxin-antitoxin system|nr:hypothetical protein [Lachnospiraceae bacterium]